METIPYSLMWWIIFIFAISPHAWLIVGLVKNSRQDKSHTFLTWLLYSAQDSLLLFSGENVRTALDPMAMGFATGSLIMALVLLVQKRFVSLTFTEILTITLIIICSIVWALCGPALAQIASICSETIIGIYLIKQTFKYPVPEYNFAGYLGFFVVSLLSIIFTRAWTIAEVGFAVSETVLNFIILIPLTKKLWAERKNIYLIQ